MVVISLSILIVSFTFICFKLAPSSWTRLSWFQNSTSSSSQVDDNQSTTSSPGLIPSESPVAVEQRDIRDTTEFDASTMPPPPPMSSGSLRTPVIGSAEATTKESNPNTLLPPASAFPAQNSIQRASTGRQSPIGSSGSRKDPPLRSVNSLMPTSTLSPLPNRSPVSASSLALPSMQGIPAKPRKKVLLTPGHSPLDWAMLSKAPDVNLRGLPPSTAYLRVTPSVLRQQTGRKGKNAWTVLGGKVYNITPYLPYHPGGEAELLKAAGRDGTKLFNEIHPWVNWETMLDACLVGIAVGEEETQSTSHLEEMD